MNQLDPKNPAHLKLLAEEAQRRFGTQLAQTNQDEEVLARVVAKRRELMPAQLNFIRDTSRFKAARCTRRAGKTFVCRQMIGEAAIAHAGEIIPYIALTRETARDLMFEPMKEWCRDVGIDAHFNDQRLRITFPNGSRILMYGAEKPKEIEKLRGGRYPLAVIDESASFGAHIEGLVRAVLQPALKDLKGTMALVGTPGEVCDGLFYRVTSDANQQTWGVHSWSIADNIYIPEEERDLNVICAKEFGGDYTHPTYRREYLGEWVPDSGTQVYQYDATRCLWDGKLPSGHDWIYGLGVDIGSVDGTAFTVVAFSPTSQNLHLIEEHKMKGERGNHLSVSQIADKLTELYGRYTFHRPVCDMGALSAMIVTELNQRHGFALSAADKAHKNDFIEHLNSDLRLGRIKIDPRSELASEMARLVWDRRLTVTGKKKEKPGLPNDICDAFLYAYREAKHWAGKEVPLELMPEGMDPEEWKFRQEKKRLIELKERQNEQDSWDYDGFRGRGY